MNILLSGEFEAAELHDWQQSLARRVAQVPTGWTATQALAVADTVQVAVVANPPPGSLRGLPKLRLIQSLWAGVDRLLLDPTLPPGVPIARMVDPAMNAAMAETALWATLALHRGYLRLCAGAAPGPVAAAATAPRRQRGRCWCWAWARWA